MLRTSNSAVKHWGDESPVGFGSRAAHQVLLYWVVIPPAGRLYRLLRHSGTVEVQARSLWQTKWPLFWDRDREMQDGWLCWVVMADIFQHDGLSADTNHCVGSTTAISSPVSQFVQWQKGSDFIQVLKTSQKVEAGCVDKKKNEAGQQLSDWKWLVLNVAVLENCPNTTSSILSESQPAWRHFYFYSGHARGCTVWPAGE